VFVRRHTVRQPRQTEGGFDVSPYPFRRTIALTLTVFALPGRRHHDNACPCRLRQRSLLTEAD
jgi:hypothetical protein